MDFSCVVESQTCLVCHERIIFPSKLKSIFCTLSSNLCGIYRIYTYSMISKGGRTDTNLIAQYSMVWIWSFDIWVYISLTRRLVYCPLCLPLTTTSLMCNLLLPSCLKAIASICRCEICDYSSSLLLPPYVPRRLSPRLSKKRE